MTIQQLLKGKNAEFDAARKVKLIRHATTHKVFGRDYDGTISDLYNDRELFLKYQRQQKISFFDGVEYIVSFISEGSEDALFVGVFRNDGRIPDEPGVVSEEGDSFFDLNPVPDFEDLIHNVIVEWKTPRAWHQWYDNEMNVVKQRMCASGDEVSEARFEQFHINTNTRTRHVEEATIDVEARHQKMQEVIMSSLEREGYTDIVPEEEHVDIRASKRGVQHFFEVKTYDTAKACIREALGQILEYCHYPKNWRAAEMYIIGPTKTTTEDNDYLQFLRDNYKLRLFYRWYDEKLNQLSQAV